MNREVLELVRETLDKVEGEDARAKFLTLFAASLPDVLDDSAENIVTDLLRSAPKMLKHHERSEATYATRLKERWGDAFGLYRIQLQSCHENGEAFSARHFNVDGYEAEPILHAQIGLQARSCRVALEVFALLRAGLGAGALARARTLHEIAAISGVLARHGTADGDNPDLADRYLAHAAVVSWLDAVEYQEVAPKLEYEPYTPSEMDAMKGARDAVVAQFGDGYGRPNGWAACLMPNQKAPRFRDIEVLAGVDHMRAHYSWASHEVHADAKSWEMNHETVGDTILRSTGPSPRGMSDAAQMGLIALTQVTVNTIHSAPDLDERPSDLLAVAALEKLLDRACEAFAVADGT